MKLAAAGQRCFVCEELQLEFFWEQDSPVVVRFVSSVHMVGQAPGL